MRWFYRAIGGGAWPVMRSHVSWCTKAMHVSLLTQNNGRRNTTWFSWRRWWRSDVWNNGCFVLPGRCGIVIWRLIAHYYYLGGTTGVRPPCCSALLFGAWHVDPVAICPTCRWQEVQNSWKRASTVEYKTRLGFLLLRAIHRYKPGLIKGRAGLFPRGRQGSFIVCSRQGGRKGNTQLKVERLSFGKIWFYGVCTH